MNTNENRIIALYWWAELSSDKKDELFKGYKEFTPAHSFNQLTGREIQNIWAVQTTLDLLKENESLRAINDELLEALKGLYDNPQPNPNIYHGADYFDRQSNNINAKINALEVITKATK